MTPEKPWVRVPANEIKKDARLWGHDGEPYARFVKIKYTPSGSMMQNGSWSLIFIGALSGLELSLRLETPTVPIKVLREDAS